MNIIIIQRSISSCQALLLRCPQFLRRISHRHVDSAYMSSYVGGVNLIGGVPVDGTLEVKMVLFGLVFLTMTIIATLYFT